jgi:hypothetical protein
LDGIIEGEVPETGKEEAKAIVHPLVGSESTGSEVILLEFSKKISVGNGDAEVSNRCNR